MKTQNLYGLVLAGGKGIRMKTDKAALEYHGKKQSAICYELLSGVCEKVFISNRKDQATNQGKKEFPQIHDAAEWAGTGPLAGILSAMQAHPMAAWLVLACDLPFVNERTLKELIRQRDKNKIATAYKSSHDNLPEPLCAIYEPQAQKILQEFWKKGTHCPRKILINSDAHLLDAGDQKALDNINTPEEFQAALKMLKK